MANYPRLGAGAFVCLALGVIAAASTAGLRPSTPTKGTAQPEILFIQAPVLATGELADRFPQGSRLVRLGPAAGSRSVINLTPEFFAAADPQVSFDGAQVLFAAQKEAGARWQIWEMNADGSAKRQITQCRGDCLRPAYLPRDYIVFTVVTPAGARSVSHVYVSKRDGTEAGAITFGPGNFQVETVLRDGRILVSALSPLVTTAGSEDSRELYTLRPDGTALAAFRCDHRQPAIRAQAAELDNGSVVFVKSQPVGHEVGGELAEIRRGALHNSPLSPLRAISWSPQRLDGHKLIVARRNPASAGGRREFDLYAFDSANGRFAELIYQDPKLSSIQAVPVAAHPVPRWYWSTVNPKLNVGYFICLDSRLSGEAPRGRLSTPIAQVRVIALDEATNQERVLGEAPVEKDGSFYVAVPPDRPIRFELLDANGRVIRAQRSWVWARSGEERGCVGCHENKAVAPPNRWPLTLRRFDTPTLLGVEQGAAAAH